MPFYRFRRRILITQNYQHNFLQDLFPYRVSLRSCIQGLSGGLSICFAGNLKDNFEDTLCLSSPLILVSGSSRLTSQTLVSVDTDTHPSLLGLALKPTLKLDKKVKKNDKDDEKELDRFGTKLKAKKKTKSKLNIEDDYEVASYNLDTDDVSEDLSPLPLARPPKPSVPSNVGISFTVKQKVLGLDSGKKKRTAGSHSKKETEAVIPDKPNEVNLIKPVTVADLSDLFLVSKTDIIKFLFLKGIPVTMNQMIDIHTAQLVGQEFGIQVTTNLRDVLYDTRRVDIKPETSTLLRRRPPIVTIMGHVDHGKTTLLDRIRKTQVAQKEAGGITQKIGAYEVQIDHNNEKRSIVFLDTPGHEAFSGMRSRGVSITDIVILVVAADDGVKKQTLEAIQYIKSANVPLIVAINKIDKEDANLNAIQEDLARHNIVSESWGGDTLVVPISAIQGTNIEKLLEMIILLSDMMLLQADPDSLAQGVVIESHLDRTKGAVATLIVQNGTLRVGDIFTIGNTVAKVRGMVNPSGSSIREAEPSSPALIWGLPKIPSVGERFCCFKDEKEAKISLQAVDGNQKSQFGSFQQMQDNYLNSDLDTKDKINLIIKTDTQGSAEAINVAISKLHDPKVQIRILYACAGEITETDIEFASGSNATLLAFNTTLASGAKKAAKNVALIVKEFDVIYDLFDYVQSMIDALVGPQYEERFIGTAIVKTVFPLAKSFVAGSAIVDGKILKSSVIEVMRGSDSIYKGPITSLKRMKEDVSEVLENSECGIFVAGFDLWKQGDLIKVFELLPKKKNTF